jgi:hypothetical protein
LKEALSKIRDPPRRTPTFFNSNAKPSPIARLNAQKRALNVVVMVKHCHQICIAQATCFIAQATCFDSKIMVQPSVFSKNSGKFSDQNTLRAL